MVVPDEQVAPALSR